jgi:hypothetical protein
MSKGIVDLLLFITRIFLIRLLDYVLLQSNENISTVQDNISSKLKAKVEDTKEDTSKESTKFF